MTLEHWPSPPSYPGCSIRRAAPQRADVEGVGLDGGGMGPIAETHAPREEGIARGPKIGSIHGLPNEQSTIVSSSGRVGSRQSQWPAYPAKTGVSAASLVHAFSALR